MFLARWIFCGSTLEAFDNSGLSSEEGLHSTRSCGHFLQREGKELKAFWPPCQSMGPYLVFSWGSLLAKVLFTSSGAILLSCSNAIFIFRSSATVLLEWAFNSCMIVCTAAENSVIALANPNTPLQRLLTHHRKSPDSNLITLEILRNLVVRWHIERAYKVKIVSAMFHESLQRKSLELCMNNSAGWLRSRAHNSFLLFIYYITIGWDFASLASSDAPITNVTAHTYLPSSFSPRCLACLVHSTKIAIFLSHKDASI